MPEPTDNNKKIQSDPQTREEITPQALTQADESIAEAMGLANFCYADDAFAKNLPEGQEFMFLPKPFTLKQLVEAVKSAMG